MEKYIGMLTTEELRLSIFESVEGVKEQKTEKLPKEILTKTLDLVIANPTKEGEKIIPSNYFLDYLVPEELLGLFYPEDLFTVALEYGLKPTLCCICQETVKVNGSWAHVPEPLKTEFYTTQNRSDGYCPECFPTYYREQFKNSGMEPEQIEKCLTALAEKSHMIELDHSRL